MTRPRLLDLFCGAGGCSVGYHRAGFDCVGVDNRPMPRYPYQFHQLDVMKLAFVDQGPPIDHRFMTVNVTRFDAIHASPPCQSETDLRHRTGVEHQDLLIPTLAALADLDLPWVVENVDSTRKLPGALMLCGASFGLGAHCKDGRWRPLRRHRLFASNRFLMGPGCACNGVQPIGVYGTGGGGQMTRGYKADTATARKALGIDWMNLGELSQAIPPAYTQHIGEQLLAHLRAGVS